MAVGLLWAVLTLLLALCAFQVLMWMRKPPQNGVERLELRLDELLRASERLERELRTEVTESARTSRAELMGILSQFQHTVCGTQKDIAAVQNHQIDQFSQRQAEMHSGVHQQLAALTESNARRLNEVRETVDGKLKQLQADNASKLEEMRRTVDERLHATLEERLGQSFRLVSERLEAVHKGLGEMQALAIGVGDLKRLMSNVKQRGGWGEMQLAMVLEQLLTADQYAANIETIPLSGNRVEFAIRLPGKDDHSQVWLPIDAKFPKEQYERLAEAAERSDVLAVQLACKELEDIVLKEAKTIAAKYLSPPLTTDFALMFLPSEGLYAEVLRRPGLADRVQREFRVTIAGPTTLTALLNSLQMGFRTLALEKRSSEVWEVLGAVKTEFSKFGETLAGVEKTLQSAASKINMAQTRTRQMQRKLKSVEAMPAPQAQHLLEIEDESEIS